MAGSLPCRCAVKIKATNIMATIHPGGHLTSSQNPIKYDAIIFCASPTCERVFRAEKKKLDDD